ncbi:MAG: NTP transferase domain-containing protein [Anaerovoracaceae bacterium]|jgi:molybdenum cofactor cytidylyltransferase
MRYGAVIVAAGMSMRMRQMKQQMEVDRITLANRVVKKFQDAGVQDIVMVTGYRAADLENSLKKLGICFIRNENYATTRMLESAKLGFSRIPSGDGRVFFCPVDVPFFRTDTIRLEMARKEQIVYPICHNRLGHPILISAKLIPSILAYTGDHGLKGALDSLYTQNTCFLPVSDEGAVMDTDTPVDLGYIEDLAAARQIRPEVRLRLSREEPFFGSGTVTLLRQIDQMHSVRQACASIGMSYSKGWAVVHTAEEAIGCRLVNRVAGGRHGGSASLTEYGRRLIELFEELERNVRKFADREYCRIFPAGDLFSQNSREDGKKG